MGKPIDLTKFMWLLGEGMLPKDRVEGLVDELSYMVSQEKTGKPNQPVVLLLKVAKPRTNLATLNGGDLFDAVFLSRGYRGRGEGDYLEAPPKALGMMKTLAVAHQSDPRVDERSSTERDRDAAYATIIRMKSHLVIVGVAGMSQLWLPGVGQRTGAFFREALAGK